MASLDSLTDPQRAILQLLLKRGKSYAEIETMLRLGPGTVQARAREAIAALGPDHPQLGADRRSEVADYLLGQQSAAVRAATREYLEDSADGRTWARDVAGTLRPLAPSELPEVPSEPAASPAAAPAGAAGGQRAPGAGEAGGQRAPGAGPAGAPRRFQAGNALLFAALGVGVAIVLIIVLGIFGGGDDDKASTSTVTRTSATTESNDPQTVARGTLAPPRGSSSDASAETGIIRYPETNNFKLLIAGKDLEPAPEGSSYGVWLYSSKSRKLFLGFPQATVTEEGALDVVADLTPDTPNFNEVLLTRERAEEPSTPGDIVLRGELVVEDRQQASPQTQTQTQPGTQTSPGTQTEPG